MLATCRIAARDGIAIGAHVSYRDLAGFGRRAMEVPRAQLHDEVLYQLSALAGISGVTGTRVRYVKPHGALYTAAGADESVARAVAAGVAAFGVLPVLGLPGSALLGAAAVAGLPAVTEGFADRAYAPDGTLVPRDVAGAVISDPAEVAAQCVALAHGEVRSVCVHGDSPGAVAAARACRQALEGAGVAVEAFA
jgi:UPF0271 protein